MKFIKPIFIFIFSACLMACNDNKTEDKPSSISQTELLTLFSFDTQKDVYENLQYLSSFNMDNPYHVNGKTIRFTCLTPEDIDAAQGTFSLIVEGKVNDTPFKEVLCFKGFKTNAPEEEEDNTVSEEELLSIFIFDKNETVTEALADLERFKGEKHINNKLVSIDEIRILKQDAVLGSFTIEVSGNVNGKHPFSQGLDFTGFSPEAEIPANRPSDFNMAARASVQTAQGKNIYDTDFDMFYREGRTDEFALQLKDFLTISSSDTDGTPYIFNEEDMQSTSLTDIRYDTGKNVLFMKVKYKEHISPELSIPFNHNEYYRQFVSVNTEETGKYYQSGVLHYIDEHGSGGHLFNLFITVRDGFRAEYMASQKTGEHINYSVRLLGPDDKELASFDIMAEGFRELKNLATELIIDGGEYSELIRNRLTGNVDAEELIKSSFNQLVTKLSFSYKGFNELIYSPEHTLYSDTEKSLYFKDVVIEFHSTVKESNGDLTLNVVLSSVNGYIIDSVIPIRHFLQNSDFGK